MTAKQRNKLAMYVAVNHVFGLFKDDLNTIPALAEAMGQFDSIVKLIHEIYQVQQGYSASSSQLKMKEEAEMIQASIQVAAVVYAYAHTQQKPDLEVKVKVSPSSLRGMTDEELLAACRNILQIARGIVAELADYGVSEESLNLLEGDINDFAALVGSPRGEIITRSQATRELKLEFKKADDLLKNSIDKLMLMMELTQPKAYNSYRAARIIVDLKGKGGGDESNED